MAKKSPILPSTNMITIVSSQFSLGTAQRNGTNYVTEVHTDNNGKKYVIEYGPIGRVDYVRIMNDRALNIAQEANDREAQILETKTVNDKLAIVLQQDIDAGRLTQKEVEIIFPISNYQVIGHVGVII